jgi:hypothetical protein
MINALTGQMESSQKQMSGNATYQASGFQSVNPRPLLVHFLWKTFLE